MPFITGGGSGGSVNPNTLAGFEIGYTAITSPVNITDTTEATATALISPGALTFDGGLVLCHVQAFVATPSTVGGFVVMTLFEGATQITRLSDTQNVVAAQQVTFNSSAFFRFTPTVGSHTYKVCAFCNSTTGVPSIQAGAGGTAGLPPAFVRFTKV